MSGFPRYLGRAIAMLLVTASSAGAQQPGQPYLGLDIFGGVSAAGSATNDAQPDVSIDDPASKGSRGWEVGTTVFVASRWLGITGSVGRSTGGGLTYYDYLLGPRFQFTNELAMARAFAHVLAGGLQANRPDGTSITSAEFVVGGGFDYSLVRLQFDYVRRQAPELPRRNGLRVFLGGVVPLCFRQCLDSDGIPVGKKARKSP